MLANRFARVAYSTLTSLWFRWALIPLYQFIFVKRPSWIPAEVRRRDAQALLRWAKREDDPLCLVVCLFDPDGEVNRIAVEALRPEFPPFIARAALKCFRKAGGLEGASNALAAVAEFFEARPLFVDAFTESLDAILLRGSRASQEAVVALIDDPQRAATWVRNGISERGWEVVSVIKDQQRRARENDVRRLVAADLWAEVIARGEIAAKPLAEELEKEVRYYEVSTCDRWRHSSRAKKILHAMASIRGRGLLPVFSNQDWARNADISVCLYEIKRLEQSDYDALIEGFDDLDARGRLHMLSFLGDHWDPCVVDLHVRALADEDAEVRRMAARTLELHPDPRAVGPMIALLRNPEEDPQTLNHAVNILTALKAGPALDAMVDLFRAQRPRGLGHVRATAQALLKSGWRPEDPAERAMLAAAGRQFRVAAEEGPVALEAIRGALADRWGWEDDELWDVIESMGDASLVGAIARVLRSFSRRDRGEWADELGYHFHVDAEAACAEFRAKYPESSKVACTPRVFVPAPYRIRAARALQTVLSRSLATVSTRDLEGIRHITDIKGYVTVKGIVRMLTEAEFFEGNPERFIEESIEIEFLLRDCSDIRREAARELERRLAGGLIVRDAG